MDQRLTLVGSYSNQEGFPLPTPTESVIVKVTKKNIEKAKTFVNKLQATACKDYKILQAYNLILNNFILNNRYINQ